MECLICLDPLNPRKKRHPTMPCCHISLHKSCFETWQQRNFLSPRCPHCNQSFPPTMVYRIETYINDSIQQYLYQQFSRSSNGFSLLEDELIKPIHDLHLTIEKKEDVTHLHLHLYQYRIHIKYPYQYFQDTIPFLDLFHLHDQTQCFDRTVTKIKCYLDDEENDES